MRIKMLLLVFLCIVGELFAQTADEKTFRTIYDQALTKGKSYEWLRHLSLQIGGRLSGSYQAQQAVDYTKKELEALGLDKVWLQGVMVPKWVRGLKEYAYIEQGAGEQTIVPICALGGSVATPGGGIKAEVVEVKNFEELKALGKEKIAGKIVFYNRPMDPKLINTLHAYGGCVNQRGSGAKEAASLGAIGVIVRSMNLRLDDYPHTGAMSYGDLPKSKWIPAAAISTNGAELLSTMIRLNPNTKFFFRQSCKNMPEVKSYNVIGEIKGTEFPNEIIIVGGHLDSWDLGDGSHDDGAGVVQSMEVLRIMKQMNYKPKRTLRVVLFMNEENGLRGGRKYAEVARQKGEKHVFALESDLGGFTPRGFTFDCTTEQFAQVQSWKKLFEPYLIHLFIRDGSGADIGPLKDGNLVLAGLRPDSQRYFDHHHSDADTFDAVNKRELELGAATMTSLIYLYDKYGVQTPKKPKG
ncbi:MAG: M20/M25/M40 family metallo-hydrolase [Flavobacteriaceae bacterium]|nr:M20/M25/M40 family metallo-hydrolase [Flavobacteriaceae bacterium]